MKKFIFFILMILGLASYAQEAQSTQIEFNKVKVPGVSVSVAGYDVDFIQNALQFRLEKVAGLKGTNSKGFRTYTAQVFHDFGFVKYDIYISIDKGTKQSQIATINLLVSKGNENFATPVDDSELTQKMKDFLTNFANEYIKEFETQQKINALTKSVTDIEKDCSTLTSDLDKMKKDYTNLENKIKEKEKELNKKKEELNKSKSELESLK